MFAKIKGIFRRNRPETIEQWARRTGHAARIQALYNPAQPDPDDIAPPPPRASDAAAWPYDDYNDPTDPWSPAYNPDAERHK